MQEFLNLNSEVLKAKNKVEEKTKEIFKKITDTAEYNQIKVLNAFREYKVSQQHFIATSGYGYDDVGRDTLDKIVARCFNKEDALIRFSFASGTATIAAGLFGVLRPNDKILFLAGDPYDTLMGVLGHKSKTEGSLTDFGIKVETVDLLNNNKFNEEEILNKLKSSFYKAVYIQRSRGYTVRPAFTVSEINDIIKKVKEISPNTYALVDNCYGEFVEKEEPDADLIMGSLIKNPGGGIAPAGGYLAGTKELIEKCAARVTAPGVGREIGASLGHNKELYMGFLNAPVITGEALKTAVFASALFKELGFEVSPEYNEKRSDIIECITLNSEENLLEFCKGIQYASAIDSFVTPISADMPGYDDKIVMAAGAFTMGSSIELSADGPVKPPFVVFLQGALSYAIGKFGVLKAANNIVNKNKNKK